MTKSYADLCLQRASMATPGPWHIGHVSETDDTADIDSPDLQSIGTGVGVSNQIFICRSRTDIEELSRRLEYICMQLSDIEGGLRRGMPVHADYLKELREDLERMPEGEK